MNNQTKVLIVLVILVLSIGPLSYFFNSVQPSQINLPNEPGQGGSPITRTLVGNLTGTVVNLKPFISYIGTASTNNAGYVKNILDTLNYTNNYTVSTTLNPYGDGYRYEITIPLKSLSDMEVIGFKMYVRLSSFLKDSNPNFPYPRAIGDIVLDPVQTVGNTTMTAGPNSTVHGVMLYAEKIGDHTSLNCPEITTSLTYNFTKAPQICGDNRQGYPGSFGASLDAVTNYGTSFGKSMQLNVTAVDRYIFLFNYTLAIQNITRLDRDLPTGTGILEVPIAKDVHQVLVSTNVTSQSNTDKIRTVLQNDGFAITEEYKYAYVVIPNSVDFNGQTYYPYKFNVVGMKLRPSEGVGTINAQVTFNALFGEITNVNVQET